MVNKVLLIFLSWHKIDQPHFRMLTFIWDTAKKTRAQI